MRKAKEHSSADPYVTLNFKVAATMNNEFPDVDIINFMILSVVKPLENSRKKPGWCTMSKKNLAKQMLLSERVLYARLADLGKLGLMESEDGCIRISDRCREIMATKHEVIADNDHDELILPKIHDNKSDIKKVIMNNQQSPPPVNTADSAVPSESNTIESNIVFSETENAINFFEERDGKREAAEFDDGYRKKLTAQFLKAEPKGNVQGFIGWLGETEKQVVVNEFGKWPGLKAMIELYVHSRNTEDVDEVVKAAELSKKDLEGLKKAVDSELKARLKDDPDALGGIGRTGAKEQIVETMLKTGWEVVIFRRGMTVSVPGVGKFVDGWIQDQKTGVGAVVEAAESKTQGPWLRIVLNRLDGDKREKIKYLRKYYMDDGSHTAGHGEHTVRYHAWIASGHRKISLFDLERIAALEDQRMEYNRNHKHTGKRGFYNDTFLETIIEPLS